MRIESPAIIRNPDLRIVTDLMERVTPEPWSALRPASRANVI
jgi:hypothetical protein